MAEGDRIARVAAQSDQGQVTRYHAQAIKAIALTPYTCEAYQSKDHLNFRYLDKRAAYVGEVFNQLARPGLCSCFACHDHPDGFEKNVTCAYQLLQIGGRARMLADVCAFCFYYYYYYHGRMFDLPDLVQEI